MQLNLIFRRRDEMTRQELGYVMCHNMTEFGLYLDNNGLRELYIPTLDVSNTGSYTVVNEWMRTYKRDNMFITTFYRHFR